MSALADTTPAPPPPPGEPAGSPARDGGPARGQPWRRALRAVLPVWLTAYAAWVAVTVFAWFHPARGPGLRDLAVAWRRYDATAYISIAEDGYRASTVDGPPAFFPLYPMLGRLVDQLLPGGAHVALLLVSAAALLALLLVFHVLVEYEFDATVAGRASWFVVLFPSAFFLGLAFNESLFIALMLGSVYAMRRGRWWLAGGLGGLAMLTRSIGLMLCLAFAYEYLRQRDFAPRRIRLDALAGLLIPAGLGGYMLYLWYEVGDPLAFRNSMTTWGRELSWPWTGIVQTFQWLPDRPALDNANLHMLLDLAAVAFAATLLVLSFVGPWRFRRDQWVLPILGAAMLLFLISFPPAADRVQPLMGAVRYVLEIVAVFVVLARIKLSERLYPIVALMLQGLLLAHFARNGWVA